MLYNNFDCQRNTRNRSASRRIILSISKTRVFIFAEKYFLLSKNVQEEVNSLKSTMRRNFDMYTYSIPRNLKTRERMNNDYYHKYLLLIGQKILINPQHPVKSRPFSATRMHYCYRENRIVWREEGRGWRVAIGRG